MVMRCVIYICWGICTVICTLWQSAYGLNKKSAAPGVTINADKTTICAKDAVTFNATPTAISPLAIYQWQVNGVDPGGNSKSTTFTTTTLQDQDKVTCTITNTGGIPATVTSNAITISYYPTLTPGVTVKQTMVNCVPTFDATPANAGTDFIYKWEVNGIDQNLNKPSFSDVRLVNNDLIECTVYSFNRCSVATSGKTSMRVSREINTLSLVIYPANPNEVCEGTIMDFGVIPSIEIPNNWYVLCINKRQIIGGHNIGVVAGSSVKEGDTVQYLARNDDPCAMAGWVYSNIFIVHLAKKSTVTLSADTNNICAGTPVTFTATVSPKQNATYQWKVNSVLMPAEHLDKFTTSNLKDADQVTCTIIANNACITPVTSNTVLMQINPLPIITLPKTIEVTLGKSVQIKPVFNTSIASYQWTPALGLSDVTIANPIASPGIITDYQLSVVSAGGCTSTASVTVKVNIVITPPNTFTPNDDGINDTWKIPELTPYTDCTVTIFDRSGQLVYQSFGYAKPWDGTRNGKELPAGTYYYVIDTKRSATKFAGSVTIIR
jgi:gliding motility-associated-like protein